MKIEKRLDVMWVGKHGKFEKIKSKKRNGWNEMEFNNVKLQLHVSQWRWKKNLICELRNEITIGRYGAPKRKYEKIMNYEGWGGMI